MYPPAETIPRKKRFRIDNRGIALLIVVSTLTVIGIMGVAFAFSMYLETQASRQFVSTIKARYIAEAAVNHAWAILDEDKVGSRIDDLDEAWTRDGIGQEADLDADGKPDSRWWQLSGSSKLSVGRYAFQISDENGKANINASLADPSSLAIGSINLTQLLEYAGTPNAFDIAQKIDQYRYGEDNRPGFAGIDDDANGAIDEASEYQILALRGDDRKIDSLEDLGKIAGLSPEDIKKISHLATVYSWDPNISVTGTLRVNVNTATANELLAVLLEAGVEDPWQAAANMADYVDTDFEISRLIKSSQSLLIGNQGTIGAWSWTEEGEGHYESHESSGGPLSWSVSVPSGKFRIIARGMQGMKVGDITVAGVLKPSVNDGESLGIFELSGTVEISVSNREQNETTCAFRGIDLVLEDATSGLVVRGIEAIRFNELMVEPKMKFDVSAATFDPQGSDWACPAGSGLCSNSGVGQARWVWVSPLLQPGRYHLRVMASAAGQSVGEVRVDGNSKMLVHGQRHPSAILVGSDRKITLTIGKTASEQTYYLKGIELSLQPDAEYIELINLSEQDVNVSGWTIEGEASAGRQAMLPAGSIIKKHSLLVAAVDLNDEQEGLSGNGIDARSSWSIPNDINAVQLEFPNGAPSADDDFLKTVFPAGNAGRLVLRSREGLTVDEVEYITPLPTTSAFQSIEKGDPTLVADTNKDGIDEEWYASLHLYTPGQPNDNDGLKEQIGLETIVHDPAKETLVLNHPLVGIGELAGLPGSKAWKPFASVDLAKVVDRFTVEGIRLEAEGQITSGQEAWQEKAEGYYEYNHTQKPTIPAAFRWIGIPDGHYRLSLYSWVGEQLALRWQRQDGAWEASPALLADAQGRVAVGQITIGMDGTPPNTLALEVTCASPSGICHVDNVRLDPQLIRVGPININTAPREVLLSLPNMTEAIVSRIIANRPYGDKDQKSRGIGDLLIGDILGAEEEDKLNIFKHIAHLLTTRSDVFQIMTIGQVMENNYVSATQRIQSVVQR